MQMRKGPLIFTSPDAENPEPLPEPQRQSSAGQDNVSPRVAPRELSSSPPIGLAHLNGAREQHPTGFPMGSERQDRVAPPNVRRSRVPQPLNGRSPPALSVEFDGHISSTVHESRVPKHSNGDGNYRGQPGPGPPSMEFERQLYSPPIAMDSRVPQPQQRQYQKRSSSMVNPTSQIPQHSFGNRQSTYRPLVEAQPQFTQSPQTQLRPLPSDPKMLPNKSKTFVKNHQPASTQSPIMNGQNRTLPITPSKPHRVLTKARGPPASKHSTSPDSSKRLSRRIPLDVDVGDRQPTSPDIWQPFMAEGVEAPGPAPTPPAPGPSPRYNSNAQRPIVEDVDPLAMRRRTKAPAERNVPAPSPAKPIAAPVPSAESIPCERITKSIPEPNDAGAITEQVASPGPYDAVAPRPRSRPMTGMFMTAFTLPGFLTDAGLLYSLLEYLTFFDWVMLYSVSKHLRKQLEDERDLREEVLERFLETVGYERWTWDEQEPLSLSLVVSAMPLR